MAATIEILLATSSFLRRFQILFTVKYPFIKENTNALETRTPINFSNNVASSIGDACKMFVPAKINKMKPIR